MVKRSEFVLHPGWNTSREVGRRSLNREWYPQVYITLVIINDNGIVVIGWVQSQMLRLVINEDPIVSKLHGT
jgi:hypothetical protein